jgi:hypothetical protein
MATIKNTRLEVNPVHGQPGKSRVTVTSTLNFTAADAQKWKYSIKLNGSDVNEPSTGQALLYTFLFPIRPYQLVNAVPGDMEIKTERIIDANLLNEDPGVVAIPGGGAFPRKDEVYALPELGCYLTSNIWESNGV